MFFKKPTRSQGAMEFLIIFGAVLFFFTVFFGIIQVNISEKNKEKEKIIAQNIALDVQDEISLAAGASDGYSRNFSLPKNILGKDYEISVSDARVYLSMDGFGTSYKSAYVNGSVIKGMNTIKKQNGTIYLN